jgi:hypothetical protein
LFNITQHDTDVGSNPGWSIANMIMDNLGNFPEAKLPYLLKVDIKHFPILRFCFGLFFFPPRHTSLPDIIIYLYLLMLFLLHYCGIFLQNATSFVPKYLLGTCYVTDTILVLGYSSEQ